MMFVYLAVAPYLTLEGSQPYKIGITKSISERMRSLSGSGVCGDYNLLHYVSVTNARACENSVFETLQHFRHRDNREIFIFDSAPEAIESFKEAVSYYLEGGSVSSNIRLPEFLLNQLEDRWYDEEYVV